MNEQIISTELPAVKPCRVCGAMDRNKSGKCMPCGKERNRNWRESNRDRALEYRRKYQESNKEKMIERVRKYYVGNRDHILERNRKWAEANREKVLERQRKWREANRDHILERDREYREANREKVAERDREWRETNPDKVIIKNHKRRARKKANGGKLSPDIVQTLLAKQSNKCACCGADLIQTGYHLDHIMPLALGGANDDSNVQLLTPKCNLSKGAKHPDDWVKEKGIACL